MTSPHFKTLSYGEHHINIRIHGHGEQLLIAFSGYGTETSFFNPALPHLENKFKVYIVDLPFHGKTEWNQPVFRIKDFTNIIQLILDETKAERFSFLGHSFGGRTVLIQTPIFADKIDQIILLAPDGIKTNSLVTFQKIPEWFRWMTKPIFSYGQYILVPFANMAYRIGFINRVSHSFANHYFETEAKRKQVTAYWISLAKYQPVLSKTKAAIKAHKIPTLMVLGTRDTIVLTDVGDILKQGIEEYVNVVEVPTGHLVKGGAVLKGLI